VLAAHGGGYLGSYAPRDDHACFVAPPGACNPNITLKKKPTEYLNELHFDALVFTPAPPPATPPRSPAPR
jgi:aminocarboxymuconate-semialdehyde decarboxylase